MNKKSISAFVALFLAVCAGVGMYFLLVPSAPPPPQNIAIADRSFGWKFPVSVFPTSSPSGLGQNLFDFLIAFSSIRDPGGIPSGLPVRLQIPKIAVDSAIEDAVITPDGRMDVPAGSVNVAWFALGPHPGQVGSAVIGGHFGINNGVKFVLYDLDKLVVGDKVYILDDEGNTLAFVVRRIQSFDRNADATTVFTSTDGLAHLNLITCEGVWNQVNGNYPQRLVIFTDAIPSEGAAPSTNPVSTPVATSAPGPSQNFNRSLTIGSIGADVVALQTFLEQRGLLELPPGVVNGYFGTLTRDAVARYQVSAGLAPPAGYFGPLTRTKVALDLGGNSTFPNTGALAIASGSPAAIAPNIVSTPLEPQAGMFGAPLSILISALLLFAIGFAAFKLLRRSPRK
jgi:sortase (surface protein transpeptidase)